MGADRHPCHSAAPVLVKSPEDVQRNILDAFDVFIFDMDGVLWKTEEAVQGAREALDFLKLLGKKVYFATNNSIYSLHQFADKMKRLGLGDQNVESIFSSANAAACYLRNIHFKGKVYMLGTEALKEELEGLPNVEVIDGFNHRNKFATPSDIAKEEIDISINAVVMGFDPYFNYYKACYATAILTHNPSSLFIVTNRDLTYPSSKWILPGTGSFISVIESATGRRGIIAGKPGPVILDKIQQNCPDVPKHRICMVGDNLKTDIDFGRSHGIGTLLVETGVHTRKDLINPTEPFLMPDFIIASIANLRIEGLK